MEEKKLFLLDAYALIYRAYYALIRAPRINSKGVNTSAIFGFVNTLQTLLTKENPSHIAVAFDPPGPTFRHEMFEQYKAQREETPEVIRMSIPIIKEIIEAFRIPILEVMGYEADDVIGTMAMQAQQKGYTTYMMTPDKDYGQLVTPHIFIYKPKYGESEFEVRGVKEVEEKYGLSSPIQMIDLLGLMGDASDNIPGCPGVGEKTASKLIKEFGSIENMLSRTNELKGALKTKIEENREQIIFSKFLATIKIDVPISFDEKALVREEADEEKLKKLFDDLEFRNLGNRIFSKPKVETPTTPIQGSLFDLFSPTPQVEEKYSTLADLKSTKHTYILCDNQEDINNLTDTLKKAEYFAVDTETTGTDPMTAKLVGISFSLAKNTAYYIPIPQKEEEARKILENFRSVLESEYSLKIGQNIKYDYLVLKNHGIVLGGKFFDTMVAHYLLEPEQRHNLDHLAEVYLKYNTIKIEELIGAKGKNQLLMSQLSPEKVVDYASEDADITLQLKEVFEERLKAENLEALFYEIEMPLIKVLADMEFTGVRLDKATLNESSEILSKEVIKLENEIYLLAGEVFNIGSPKQVGEILFDKLQIDPKAKKTKGGQYSTTEEIMEKLRSRHPIIGKILELRGLKKLLSTYINALPELINAKTGKIHTSFNQTVTATGRLSSSNPNLQNIPIRGELGREIRRAFIPDDGCLFYSADYSQIELRIMADLSQDPNMIEAFRSGEDIHAATAAKIYKIALSNVTQDMRRKAKTANFGIIYGISVFGLAERLNIPRGEAKTLIEGYFETYPQIKEYMEKCIDIAKGKGYVETVSGRKRMLPDINSHNSVVRGYAERNAINAPIQGSAADIIKIAMVAIDRRLRKENLKTQMIIQVHDELNFNMPKEEAELASKIVKEEMENAYKLSVPLIVDSGLGNNWLEAH